MTIKSEVSRARYVSNGVTNNFAISFPYLTNNDGTAQIAVYVGDSDTPLVEGKDYTVNGFGKYDDYSEQVDDGLITYETRYEGGEVLLKEVPADQIPVAIVRDIPQTQGVVFVEGEDFPARDFENALDKLTMEVQEVKENLERSIILPPTSTEKPIAVRDNILVTANKAQEIANEAIKLVEAAPAIIEQETSEAIKEVNTTASNAVAEITATGIEAMQNARIWAEGEQMEVEPLGGQLSSRGFANLAQAIANTPVDVPIDASSLLALDVIKGPKGDKGDRGEDGRNGTNGEGLEIGDIGFAPFGIDESQNKRRYLNGQIIPLNQFESFTNKLRRAIELYPNLATTEENWQAEVTNSKLGQCGKFVIDDTLGTIRLPKVVNINGLQDLALMGSVKAESLPNITGSWMPGSGSQTGGSPSVSGCVVAKTGKISGDNNPYSPVQMAGFEIDASLSSSTYQDNAPVQQEAILYPYFIQVATGVEESVDVTREIELNNPFFLGMSQYFESEPKNASWLKSNGSFHSGATYASFYEWLLKVYNGAETVEGVSVKSSADAYDDYDYVINTADMTFRLPLLDGSEDLPSDRYDDLTLLASGSTYTAPANGWFCLAKASTASGQYLDLVNSNNNLASAFNCTASGQTMKALMPVKKEHRVIIKYNLAGAADIFRFIYAQGNGSLYYYVGDTVQDANLINASKVLEAIAKLESYDYVVESKTPTAEDPNWYRVYKSGWVEQGGITPSIAWQPSGANATVSFIKKMVNTEYFISATMGANGTNWHAPGCRAYPVDENSASIDIATTGSNQGSCTLRWEVKGQGA